MKLYLITYGNGWLGSKSNAGSVYVIANSVKEAKELLNKKGVKLSHMGAAKQINALS